MEDEDIGLMGHIIQAGGGTAEALGIVNIIPISLQDLVRLEKLLQEVDSHISIIESMVLGKYELKEV